MLAHPALSTASNVDGVTVQGSQGQAVYRLGFDQAGSLKAVASQDPDGALRVVKTVDYDSFGNILSDSNPNLFLPLGFAGGLRDRFTGLVRFCHGDYDPTVGRFTAPDPLGDTGGDHDLYDYCVDEPVTAVDPKGLSPGSIIWSGVEGAAGGAAAGAIGGSVLPGVGNVAGALAGGLLGFPVGLLKGVLIDHVFKPAEIIDKGLDQMGGQSGK